MSGTLTIGGRPPEALAIPAIQDRSTASARREGVVDVPRLVRYPSTAAALRGLAAQWLALADLLDALAALERRRAALAGKLADPALLDHPKRPAAEARWEELWRERGELLSRIEAQAVVTAKVYAALPAAAQARWADGGWPRTADPWRVRQWIEAAALRLWQPAGECPF